MSGTLITADRFTRFERIHAVEEAPRCLLATLGDELLRIDVVADDVVRVKISRGGAFDESPTHAVCRDPLSLPVTYAVEREADVVRIRTSAMVVSLWLDPFRLDVHRPDGSAVVETARDADGRYWPYARLNDEFLLRRRCRDEDAVYGLGEKSGRGNRRGRDFTLWNVDVLDPVRTVEFTAGRVPEDPRADRRSAEFDPFYVSIPFCYHRSYPSGAMAGSFVDNGYRGHYDFTSLDEYTIRFEGGQYTEYIFAGPDMPAILERYTWLTGRTQPPPLWALGYHQCRWRAYDQRAVEGIADRLRAEQIPCDALWLDIEFMRGYRVFTWDEELFPDVPGMLGRLAEQGFRTITIVDPGVKHEPGYWVYDQAVERDVLCRTESGDHYLGQVWPGDTAFPDFALAEARQWWGELNARHVASGIAGIWNDMNEPATGDISPDAMRFGRGAYSHARFHNQYALLMAMGTTEGLLAAMPDRRTFVLSRAGSAGIQRYAANWMGDNLSRWDHLWMSIPMACGLGVSGQPFVGADVGGFEGNTSPELLVRWSQYGALTPFFRNHTARTIDQYPWAFGDAVRDLVRDAVRLRYRLMPYLYASFLRATETGAPVQRPLVFDHQYDAGVRDISDQYLFGPDLMVAPVLEPGQTARQVYLPAGDWYDWHTDEPLAGLRFVTAPTPMDRIPIYARAGAVVPMWPHVPDSTAGYHPSTVELHLYVPRCDGSHTSFLTEDDGLTFAARTGACYRTDLTVDRAGDTVRVSADVTGEGYPEFARTAFHLVVHGAEPIEAQVNGGAAGWVDGRIVVPNSGEPFEVVLTLSATRGKGDL